MLSLFRRRKPICGCGHHICFHKDGTGPCVWVGVPRRIATVGEYTPKCVCLRYVGPEAPASPK